MKLRTLLSNILLSSIIVSLVFGIATKKIDLEKITNTINTNIHYYKMAHSKDYTQLNIRGVPVFVAQGFTSEDKEKINYALQEAGQALTNQELKGLQMVVYTPINHLPDYMQNNESISRNVNNDLTEGFYAPSLKEIYIFPDIIQRDSSFDQNDEMLYVTLHEIGHHIDLSIKNHKQDGLAEKRANISAFNKISSLGINLDESTEKFILDSR